VLSISYSNLLTSLKVSSRRCLLLKYLKIWDCRNLKVLKLSAPKLETFEYFGPQLSGGKVVLFAPSLVELFLGGPMSGSPWRQVLPTIDKLRTLKLGFAVYSYGFSGLFFEWENTGVTHLEISLETFSSGTADLLTTILLPFLGLQRLTLKWCASRCFVKTEIRTRRYSLSRKLKVVEFIGFNGFECEIQLLLQLHEYYPMLERIVINPCVPYAIGTMEETTARLSNRYKQAKRTGIGTEGHPTFVGF
ncbi:hypothetical protein Tsubulata_000608, partial [Turnera subulata]